MTLEKLKKMLEDGVISQNEFDEMVSKLGFDDKGDDGKDDDKKDDGKKDNGLPENIQSLIQSAVDRATNKLGNENKDLRKQLEELRKANMTAEEVRQLELEEKLKLIADKEAEIKEKELRMFTSNGIRDAGLDDGSDIAGKLVDVLIGSDEDTITAKIASFKALLDRTVESQVKQRFKESGRDIGKGGNEDKGDDGNDKSDSVAVKLAKTTAENNKNTQSIINHYSGGKTE